MQNKTKDKLRRIMNKYDPIGIYVNDKTNIDEYDPEIKEIVMRFRGVKDKSEFLNDVHSVFIEMFDKKIAGPKNRYKDLAEDLYLLLRDKNK